MLATSFVTPGHEMSCRIIYIWPDINHQMNKLFSAIIFIKGSKGAPTKSALSRLLGLAVLRRDYFVEYNSLCVNTHISPS